MVQSTNVQSFLLVDLHVTEVFHFMQFLTKYKIGCECEFDEGLQLGPLEGMKW